MQNIYEYCYNSIKKQYDALFVCKAGVLKRDDPEDLHQMRVAVRRLRVNLKLLQDLIGSKRYELLANKLKKLAKVLGKARDKDVAMLYISKCADLGLNMSAINFVSDNYAEKKKKALVKLKAFLDSDEFNDIAASIDNVLFILSDNHSKRKLKVLKTIYNNKLSSLILDIFAYSRHDSLINDDKALHKLRIAIKHLRYTIEIKPFDGDRFCEFLNYLKKTQEQLGIINDNNVLSDNLIKLLSKNPDAGTYKDEIMEIVGFNTSVKDVIKSQVAFPWDEYDQGVITKLYCG